VRKKRKDRKGFGKLLLDRARHNAGDTEAQSGDLNKPGKGSVRNSLSARTGVVELRENPEASIATWQKRKG